MNAELFLVALITLAITPIAAADIYKCNGPDGPVYTDWKCGPDATNVELLDSSGLGGISGKTKTQLAEKSVREKSRNRVKNTTVINNQYTTINTPPVGVPQPAVLSGRKSTP